jgi:D-glycero-D-manno-heptose 1,7-bisphosphate phosphatase
MKRAVFLDRDGTVIVERHYLSNPEEVELIAGVGAALRELHEMGLAVALVTNQSAIGRGFFDLRRLKEIHGRLQELLDAEGVCLEGIYFCPHTPADGCSCRKPNVGLLEDAAKALQVDPHDCFVIGDKLCDMEAGRRIGATTLLVRTGYGAEVAAAHGDCADYIVSDMGDAVSIIGRVVARAPAVSKGEAPLQAV